MASAFENLFRGLEDLGLTDVLLPFLLVFTILFAILEKTRPDLIITDIMMPNMDGLELIRLLKADPEWRSIPIAVGSAAAILRDQAYELGIVDLVEHPCTPERLIEMITRALQI